MDFILIWNILILVQLQTALFGVIVAVKAFLKSSPYAHRNSSISEINDTCFYLESGGNGNLRLKKSHEYYINFVTI